MKQLRIEKKLTQQDLAVVIGVHRSTIGNMEDNRSKITKEQAQKIAKVLGLKEAEDIYVLGG
ncbi:helix-turn-helix transcriptional regulator [Pelosinus propionicus]|uniref:helix-turn-helix transcriptional regulator n=1 Tax=Pelosinus propionicus TaxID=380084 RepID=UPI002481CFC5|nr:helix-turn-helix transcriptional regulator [Pelosinus propionicus]